MRIEKRELLREGKAKILYHTNEPDKLIQTFKDDATAFNAKKRGTIAKKGQINNRISSLLFERLESEGVPTHFLGTSGSNDMVIRRLEMIPVEVVIRNRAAGSICQRLGITRGERFSEPLHEFFLKSDALGDPLIGESHIALFQWARAAELTEMVALAKKVNAVLRQVFERIGLELVDFKLEFGRGDENKVFLGDEISPDGCRLWDLKSGESMDKDRFRHDMGRVEEAYATVEQLLIRELEGKS